MIFFLGRYLVLAQEEWSCSQSLSKPLASFLTFWHYLRSRLSLLHTEPEKWAHCRLAATQRVPKHRIKLRALGQRAAVSRLC